MSDVELAPGWVLPAGAELNSMEVGRRRLPAKKAMRRRATDSGAEGKGVSDSQSLPRIVPQRGMTPLTHVLRDHLAPKIRHHC